MNIVQLISFYLKLYIRYIVDLCTPLFHIRFYVNIGIILTIVHSMALGYSAMIIIIERNEGLLDRTWVAGVTPAEFSLAHFLVSLVVNLLQVC